MRILHTTGTYPPSVNGVALQVHLLANTARKLGHQVKILAPDHPNAPSNENDVIRYRSYPNPFTDNYPIGIPLFPAELLERFKPDIIHTHHPLYIGYTAAYIAKHNQSPLFFTHHTSYEQYISSYLPVGVSLTKKVFRTHLKDFSQRVHTIICPSKHIRDQLKHQNITNTQIIPNGIDIQNFSPSDNKPIKLHLIYTGRLSKEKSPEKLITLSKHLKSANYPFHLTIVGTGKLAPKIEQQVKNNHLRKYITLTGAVERKHLPTILRKHHFFISYSITEVMPLTIIEAQACGLPTLVPKTAKHPMLINTNNSLCLESDYPSAVNQIINLFENKTKLYQMSLRSQRDAQQYAIEITTKTHLDLYQSAPNSNIMS